MNMYANTPYSSRFDHSSSGEMSIFFFIFYKRIILKYLGNKFTFYTRDNIVIFNYIFTYVLYIEINSVVRKTRSIPIVYYFPRTITVVMNLYFVSVSLSYVSNILFTSYIGLVLTIFVFIRYHYML